MSKELRFTKRLASLSKLICLTDVLVSGPRVGKTSYDKHKAMVAQLYYICTIYNNILGNMVQNPEPTDRKRMCYN